MAQAKAIEEEIVAYRRRSPSKDLINHACGVPASPKEKRDLFLPLWGRGTIAQAMVDEVSLSPHIALTPQNPYLLCMSQTLQELREDFSYLDEWEDRYKHVIELGRALPAMPDALKTSATKVNGCASQVWIYSRIKETPEGRRLELVGDSDALIVKGLIAIAFMIYAPLTVQQIAALDAVPVFSELGLKEHLTPQRSNGLASMVARIKADAIAAAAH
jgi:cysteine desulfuration protein SufE